MRFLVSGAAEGCREGEKEVGAEPVAKKRVELNRWHGLPLGALHGDGTLPAPSRRAGE